MARDFTPPGPGNCPYCAKSSNAPDYKDIQGLTKYVSVQGKMYDRKRIGTCARHQRKLTRAVKQARFLGLLRYVGR